MKLPAQRPKICGFTSSLNLNNQWELWALNAHAAPKTRSTDTLGHVQVTQLNKHSQLYSIINWEQELDVGKVWTDQSTRLDQTGGPSSDVWTGLGRDGPDQTVETKPLLLVVCDLAIFRRKFGSYCTYNIHRPLSIHESLDDYVWSGLSEQVYATT